MGFVRKQHFPDSDTDTDSHSLPIINHSKERLDSVEILFKILIDSGLDL